MVKRPSAKTIDKYLILVVPTLIGILICVLINCFKVKAMDIKDGMELCKMLISIWVTMLGFMITTLSIMFALHDNKYMKMLYDTGHIKTIIYSFSLCCIFLLIAVIGMLIIIFFDIWSKLSFYFVVCSTIIIVLLIVVSLWFFFTTIARNL